MDQKARCTACRCLNAIVGDCIVNPCLCHGFVPLHDRLKLVHDRLTYEVIRGLESRPIPATLSNGQRLRGIALPNGVFLGRDRKFYGTVGQPPATRFAVLSYGDVLARVSLENILKTLQVVLTSQLSNRSRYKQALRNFVKFLVR